MRTKRRIERGWKVDGLLSVLTFSFLLQPERAVGESEVRHTNGNRLMELGFFIGGMSAGALAVLLIARTQHVLEIRKRVEKDVDKHLNLMARRIWAQHMPLFSELIQAISPGFCAIYAEAAAAESGELTQICGLGYGKALEFLVKDYAKRENPSKHLDIEQSSLGYCIKAFVKDPSIRDSAELAAWLRNDEAHYLRKYATKDVRDLRALIALTIKLIENSDLGRQMEVDVQAMKTSFSKTTGD